MTAAKRILMVSHYFDSHQGGVELVAGQMYRRIARRGDVRICWAAAGVSDVPTAIANGTVLPLKTWNGVEDRIGLPFPVPSPGALRELRRSVRGSDALLVHDCLYLGNIAAYLFARAARVPVIIVQHSMARWSNPLVDAIMRAANALVTRGMMRGASQVVFISNTTKAHFESVRFRRPPQLVFNGVDTETFSPLADPGRKPAIRERLGLPRDRPVALFVGRFVEKKGLPILREMARRSPDITWALAGRGPIDPASWRADNVRVFTGLLGSPLADLYRASDVFVLASEREGFPLVIQEAISCGLPVVCSTDVVKADAALEDIVRAVPLDASDVDRAASAFLGAVRDILSLPPSAARRGEWHEIARQRYAWSHAIDRYLEIASKLAEGLTATANASVPRPARHLNDM